jgi:Sec7 domain
LRHFLTNSGFKLPGEAQRIDRMVSTFAQAYFEDNAGDNERCPFRDHDIIYLIVFAMIMLNTDLHKADFSGKKGQKKMTKTEFINNLRGALQGEIVPREYLVKVYDSIESNPIVMNDDVVKPPDESQKRTIHDMISCVRDKDSLLRSLAVHSFQFASVADFTANLSYNRNDALTDLTRSCVSKTWHHWHGVVNTCMDTAHLDPNGMDSSVEILLYALCATICLNMHVERSAFIAQLVRLKAFEEHRQGRWVSAPQSNFQEEKWALDLEEACSGTIERKIWAMQQIYRLIRSLQAALQSDVPNKVGMAAAVTEIVNGSFLLQDPSRTYVRSGDLVKKSLRTGRSSEYRFYLFSDILIYATRQSDGQFKIHEELPLHLMKVVDWFPPAHGGKHTVFEVHHPRKTFQAVCKSIDDRKSWVSDVRAAISEEIDRKMKVEAARMAFYSAQRYSSSM